MHVTNLNDWWMTIMDLANNEVSDTELQSMLNRAACPTTNPAAFIVTDIDVNNEPTNRFIATVARQFRDTCKECYYNRRDNNNPGRAILLGKLIKSMILHQDFITEHPESA